MLSKIFLNSFEFPKEYIKLNYLMFEKELIRRIDILIPENPDSKTKKKINSLINYEYIFDYYIDYEDCDYDVYIHCGDDKIIIIDSYDYNIQRFITQCDLNKYTKFYFNLIEGVNYSKNIINNLPITTEIIYIYCLHDLDKLKDINLPINLKKIYFINKFFIGIDKINSTTLDIEKIQNIKIPFGCKVNYVLLASDYCESIIIEDLENYLNENNIEKILEEIK
jgi:hypothetical protein